MNNTNELRKNFLQFSIVLVTVCALLILFLMLSSNHNLSGGKVATSAMILWLGAFIVFLCALHYQYPKRQWLAIIGSVCAGLFVLMVLYETWKPHDSMDEFRGGGFWGQTKFVMLMYVFSFSFAQMALVMLIKPISDAVAGLQKFTVGAIFGVMAMTFYTIYLTDRPSEGLLKVFVVVAILQLFGMTITPMVYKLHKYNLPIAEISTPEISSENLDANHETPQA